MKESHKRVRFETEQEAKTYADDWHRVVIVDWTGPGWYAIFSYDKPCPRGCCRDNVFEAMPVRKWADLIADEMKDLACELKEARSYITS